MTSYEWITRCKLRFAKRTNDYEYDWSENAEICYQEMYKGFEDDPEACADEEISNWD